MQGILQLALLLLSSVEIIPLFEVTEDVEASTFSEVTVDALALFIDTDGNDMQMVAVYVLVLDDDIRLVAIALALHVLMCHLRQFAIGQFVVRMGIERDVDDRLLCSHLIRHVPLKVMQGLDNVNFARTIVEDLVGIKQQPLALIHLVGIVFDGSKKAGADSNLCYHLSLASFASETIFCPCSII